MKGTDGMIETRIQLNFDSCNGNIIISIFAVIPYNNIKNITNSELFWSDFYEILCEFQPYVATHMASPSELTIYIECETERKAERKDMNVNWAMPI